jgi:hypothetical protein
MPSIANFNLPETPAPAPITESHADANTPAQDTAPVQQLNCVYDDSEGTSKRILVKVKRIGTQKVKSSFYFLRDTYVLYLT